MLPFSLTQRQPWPQKVDLLFHGPGASAQGELKGSSAQTLPEASHFWGSRGFLEVLSGLHLRGVPLGAQKNVWLRRNTKLRVKLSWGEKLGTSPSFPRPLS